MDHLNYNVTTFKITQLMGAVFHQPKVKLSVKGYCSMKIINKKYFEHDMPPEVNECRAPPIDFFC